MTLSEAPLNSTHGLSVGMGPPNVNNAAIEALVESLLSTKLREKDEEIAMLKAQISTLNTEAQKPLILPSSASDTSGGPPRKRRKNLGKAIAAIPFAISPPQPNGPAGNTRAAERRRTLEDIGLNDAAVTTKQTALPPDQATNVAAKSQRTFDFKFPVPKLPETKIGIRMYHLSAQSLPDDIGGLRKAMSLHIRILWGLLTSKETPKNPPQSILVSFNQRFRTEAQLHTSQDRGPALVPTDLVQIGTLISANSGNLANQARLVEECMLEYIQACLAKFGLTRWWPDLCQSAYSLYNEACRIIALQTFRQAILGHAYIHLNPNTVYISNTPLLIKIYDHFVFYFMFRRYSKEGRKPGSVTDEMKSSPAYRRRQRLSEARVKFLRKNKYPRRYIAICSPKATSDDEYDPQTKVYYITRRPERSKEAEMFIRLLDIKRQADGRLKKNGWKERTRIVPTDQQDSNFLALPDEKVPIDYFDPIYFNCLQPSTRNRIAKAQVTFLPNVEDWLTGNNSDEYLSDKAFNIKYGKPIFEKYRMVDDADLADDEYDETEEDKDEGDVEEDDFKMADGEGVED